MNCVRRAALAAASLCLALSAPALAQDKSPLVSGDFVEVSGVTIADGHALHYAEHIANMWKKGQDFAVAQGWITSYEVLSNIYARKGEPDIYLITRFARFADPAEEEKRDAAYTAHMQLTMAQLDAGSGERAKYRTLNGSMLLREEKFRK